MGVHPLLGLVRDHFIKRGMALVPWEGSEEPDFCLIGADISPDTSMPLAQLELQKMHVKDLNAVVLSSHHVLTKPSLHTTAAHLYARCAEYEFYNNRTIQPQTLIIRPCNVFGPSVANFIPRAIIKAKQKAPLVSPGAPKQLGYFIWEEDFLRCIDHLLDNSAPSGTYDVTSSEQMSYDNVLRNIWKFVNDNNTEPKIQHLKSSSVDYLPDVTKLEGLGWKPKTSIRSGLFRMVQL